MARYYDSDGFTIVELLIVIVVIAILAAISIVAYNGIQDRGNASAVSSDLRNMASKIHEAKIVGTNDQFPPATQAGLEAFAAAAKSSYFVGASGSFAYCRDDASFALAARSKSGDRFVISSTNGTVLKNSFSWTGNLANLCTTTLGVSGTGAAQVWFMGSNGTWASWVKG